MAEPGLSPFAADDQFLRRVLHHDQIKKLVHWRAFKDGDPRLSLTYRNQWLKTDEGLDAYRKYFSERAGTSLAGILWHSFHGLTRRVDPPLIPAHDPDESDPAYGDLHCSTQAPDKAQMQLLAKLVNDGEHAGVARRYSPTAT